MEIEITQKNWSGSPTTGHSMEIGFIKTRVVHQQRTTLWKSIQQHQLRKEKVENFTRVKF